MSTPRSSQIAYIIDTPRCVGPQTFMTNMLQVTGGVGTALRVGCRLSVARRCSRRRLHSPTVLPCPPSQRLPPLLQACSILYKSRLPVLLVFNKARA